MSSWKVRDCEGFACSYPSDARHSPIRVLPLCIGACGGELACSTCHLIFEQAVYDTLPEKEDDEDDMLDLAFEVTETSRLGCQIYVRADFAGMKVRLRGMLPRCQHFGFEEPNLTIAFYSVSIGAHSGRWILILLCRYRGRGTTLSS
jgi:ferredoxin